MGKLVKFCSSCDEGFADRFAFCPTCGATLQAFEMKPLDHAAESVEAIPESIETAPVVEASAEPSFVETAYDAPAIVDEPVIEETIEAGHIDEEEIEIEEPDDDVPATVSVPAAAAASVFATQAMYADEPRTAKIAEEPRAMTVTPGAIDSGYYITVIEEKNGSQRNMLLLASAAFCVVVALSATVYSLFDKDLGVGAIDDGNLFSAVIVDDPMATEEPEPEKKAKDKDDGGGGGGGKKDPNEVNQGDLPDQTKNPLRPPDPKVPRFQAELVTPPPSTEGDKKFEKKYGQWGDPTKFGTTPSSGPGSGGGMGTGTGPGVGSGRGTGTGSGSGSGYGGGVGDGDGDGTGPGGGAPPPKAVAAVTQPLKIISKPRAGYTDAARTNNVQGSVRLKVTFLASGAIGSVVPVTRLPHGLTEQAIAAAKQIRFEPKKINGVAQNVIVTMDYGFNIY